LCQKIKNQNGRRRFFLDKTGKKYYSLKVSYGEMETFTHLRYRLLSGSDALTGLWERTEVTGQGPEHNSNSGFAALRMESKS